MWNGGSLARPRHAAHGPAARGRLGCLPGRRRREPAERPLSPDGVCRALAQRAPRMADHHRAVAQMSATVARAIGLRDEALHAVIRAAELHDVGKIAVPDAILNKPGPLDEHEWRFMRRHTIIGEDILSVAPALQPVATLVRASHERWDGAGYPDGTSGEEIPEGARIVAVCDAFSAMVQDRPYQPGLTVGEAVDEVERCAGRHFDPRVVEAFAAEIGSEAVPA
jgi:two-component system, cell cycle response regulator